MGKSRLSRDRRGNSLYRFSLPQFFIKNVFDLFANAVYSLIGYNCPIDVDKEIRRLFRSPLRDGKFVVCLSLVEHDLCA